MYCTGYPPQNGSGEAELKPASLQGLTHEGSSPSRVPDLQPQQREGGGCYYKPPLKTEVLLILVWELSPHYPPDRMGADSIRDAGLDTSPRGMSFSASTSSFSSSSSAAAPQHRGRHNSASSQTPSLAGFQFLQPKAAAGGQGASTPPSPRLPTAVQVSLAGAFSQG